MKTAFILFFVVLMWGLTAKAGLPPTTLSGQSQTIKPTTFTFKTPNNQSTQTSGIESLIETGNSNILSNPSFEHSTFSTSWTNSAGTFTQETSVLISGKASAKLVLAAQTMALTQSSTLYAAQFADGVQGIAMVRVKSGIALSVCSIQAGVVSTTNCVTTATDSKWGLYKIPFILGGTSNGISIASSGSVTGTVYVDDAFVGTANIIDTQPLIGPWTSYTPTFTGFGTATSIEFQWRQNGQNVEIRGKFTSGTATAVEARMSLPNSFTSANSTVIPSLQLAGLMIQNVSAATYFYETVLIEPSVGYVTFGRQQATVHSLQKLNGSSIAASGDIQSFYVSIPIANLSGSTSTYSSQCGANCVDTFSASASNTSVISNENANWINGNCSYSGGDHTCTFVTGIFTVAPNCLANIDASSGSIANITSTSTSTVVVRTKTLVGVDTQLAFKLICQKQGADFTASRTIQGSFKEVMVATGVTKPKTCYYAFGGASATLAAPTECTTGTCIEVYDSCGTGTPPARGGGAGNYFDLTFASGTFAANSVIDCKCSNYDTTSTQDRLCNMTFVTGDQTWSSNGSGGAILNALAFSSGGTGQDGYVQIKCEGSAP